MSKRTQTACRHCRKRKVKVQLILLVLKPHSLCSSSASLPVISLEKCAGGVSNATYSASTLRSVLRAHLQRPPMLEVVTTRRKISRGCRSRSRPTLPTHPLSLWERIGPCLPFPVKLPWPHTQVLFLSPIVRCFRSRLGPAVIYLRAPHVACLSLGIQTTLHTLSLWSPMPTRSRPPPYMVPQVHRSHLCTPSNHPLTLPPICQ